MYRRRARMPAATLAAVLLAGLCLAGPAAAQDGQRPIDRWLVSHVARVPSGVNPLDVDGRRLFPDRDLTIGPGYWTLLRDDGQPDFSLGDVGDRPADATTTLTHAYIKAPHDLTASLILEWPDCADPHVWLNGQGLGSVGRRTPIRLAAGWNGLLVSLVGDEACSPRISASLSESFIPGRDDEDPLDLASLTIQASNPPGARPNHPEGALLLDNPVPVAITWHATEEQLVTTVSYSVSAWGGAVGLRPPVPGELIPDGPPTVDLTGEWSITFYMPTGIQTSHSTLHMSEDGTLTGRLEGERLEGEIRDGWVSGDEFGWRMRFGGRGRDLQLNIRGVLTGNSMTGSVDFGGFRDFNARFDGERADPEEQEDETGGEPAEEADDAGGREAAEETPPTEVPEIPDRADPDAAQGDEIGAPADPDGQRARIVGQLLPPPQRPPEAAPSAASIELNISGAELEGAFEGLEPLQPQSASGDVEFSRSRSAALDERGVEARIRWNDDTYDFTGRLSAAELLDVLHQPIALAGWGLAGAGGFAGTFRIPDTLDGFGLRVGEGDWLVDGVPPEGGVLCQPCRGGQRYDLKLSGTTEPVVEIMDTGYPGARGAEGVPAAEVWLESLRGDNEGYRDLARQFGEGGV